MDGICGAKHCITCHPGYTKPNTVRKVKGGILLGVTAAIAGLFLGEIHRMKTPWDQGYDYAYLNNCNTLMLSGIVIVAYSIFYGALYNSDNKEPIRCNSNSSIPKPKNKVKPVIVSPQEEKSIQNISNSLQLMDANQLIELEPNDSLFSGYLSNPKDYKDGTYVTRTGQSKDGKSSFGQEVLSVDGDDYKYKSEQFIPKNPQHEALGIQQRKPLLTRSASPVQQQTSKQLQLTDGKASS